MKSRFKMFQGVVARRNLTEPDLMGAWGRGKRALVDGRDGVLEGTHGVIVEMFENPPGLAVEFFDDEGETIDVAFIPEGYVRAETKAEEEQDRALTERLNSQP